MRRVPQPQQPPWRLQLERAAQGWRGGRWYAPNITSDGKQGVGGWSSDEIVTYLREGKSPDGGVVVGPMKQTIKDSLRYLSDEDLHAIAAYLKSFSGQQTYKPASANQTADAAAAGAQAYLSNCASCHGVEGKGVKGMIPALAGNSTVNSAGPQTVIRVVVGGLPASGGYAPMPAAGASLTDQQVADIVNYVRTGFGNTAPANAESGTVAKLRRRDDHHHVADAEGRMHPPRPQRPRSRRESIRRVCATRSPVSSSPT